MTGETEKDVSGWTVDTLRTHLLSLIADRDRHAEERAESYRRGMAEIDVRHQQRYDAQTKAVEAAFLAQQTAMAAALQAAEKAVLTAMVAAEKAVAKAEAAAEKRFESVNEFRGQLTDQAQTFMPRSETEQRLSAMGEKIDLLSKYASNQTGRAASTSQFVGFLVGGLGVLVAIIGVVAAILAQ